MIIERQNINNLSMVWYDALKYDTPIMNLRQGVHNDENRATDFTNKQLYLLAPKAIKNDPN